MLQWVILGYTCSLTPSITFLHYHSRKSPGGSIVITTMTVPFFFSPHKGRRRVWVQVLPPLQLCDLR